MLRRLAASLTLAACAAKYDGEYSDRAGIHRASLLLGGGEKGQIRREDAWHKALDLWAREDAAGEEDEMLAPYEEKLMNFEETSAPNGAVRKRPTLMPEVHAPTPTQGRAPGLPTHSRSSHRRRRQRKSATRGARPSTRATATRTRSARTAAARSATSAR